MGSTNRLYELLNWNLIETVLKVHGRELRETRGDKETEAEMKETQQWARKLR